MRTTLALALALTSCLTYTPSSGAPSADDWACETPGSTGWTACAGAANAVRSCCPGEDWTNLTPEALCGDLARRGDNPRAVCEVVASVAGACGPVVRAVARGDLPVPGVCR